MKTKILFLLATLFSSLLLAQSLIAKSILQYPLNVVSIPAGKFKMGFLNSENFINYERPVHTVTISKPFYMSTTEITQAQWQQIMGNNPSIFKKNEHPVENVSWNDVQIFIKKLNKLTNKNYRLPSEAEWEYAARANSTSKYNWGDNIGNNNANCNGCGSIWDNKQTAPVASFKPNIWGLYDMSGNVWEWTADCVNKSYKGAPVNGSAWLSGNCDLRTLRGGTWNYPPHGARSSSRSIYGTSQRHYINGFRLILNK